MQSVSVQIWPTRHNCLLSFYPFLLWAWRLTWRCWPRAPAWCFGSVCLGTPASPCAGIAAHSHRFQLQGDTNPSHNEAGDTPPCTHRPQICNILKWHECTAHASMNGPCAVVKAERGYLDTKLSAAVRGMAGRSTVSEHDDWMMPSSMLTSSSSSVSYTQTRDYAGTAEIIYDSPSVPLCVTWAPMVA